MMRVFWITAILALSVSTLADEASHTYEVNERVSFKIEVGTGTLPHFYLFVLD